MKTEDTRVPAPPASDGGLTIHNRLHPGHRCRAAVDEALRVSLRDLSGPWDVSVCPVDEDWVRIEVAAPDGASWSMSVPVPEGPRVEDLAGTVRAACLRHSRRRRGAAKRVAGAAEDAPARKRGDGGDKARGLRTGVASPSFPDAPGGTSK